MAFSTVANSPAITPIEKQRRGLLRIVLTNFENQSADEVGAGSVVEQGGSLYYADANTAISGMAGISNSSHYWIKLVPSGSDLVPTATTTQPTWSNTKHGWYDGNDLYIGGGYKDGSGNYTDKYLFHFAQYSLKSLSDGLSLRGNSNADRRLVFADDAEILWDESEDEFNIAKNTRFDTVDTDGVLSANAGVDLGGAGMPLKCKKLEIGDWDMDTDTTKTVAHGLGGNWKNVRHVTVIVRNDSDTRYDIFDGGDTYYPIYLSATNVYITHGSNYRHVDWNATSYNRGWIIIWYEV